MIFSVSRSSIASLQDNQSKLTSAVFLSKIRLSPSLAVLLCFACCFASSQETYVEGKHYLVVAEAPEPVQQESIEVIEFFSYACQHCFRFERYLNGWLKTVDADVKFRRIPVVFQKSWEPVARVFYVAEQLDVLPKLHDPLFAAIHRKKQSMDDADALYELLVDHIDEHLFKTTYQSEDVTAKLRQTQQIMRTWVVKSVPTMVVDGRFLVDPDTATKNSRKFIRIVDFLIERVRAERSQNVEVKEH